MRYRALACDYDGTLATHGKVEPTTMSALRALQASGCKLILVTGRVLEDLQQVMPELAVFDLCVLENGAVLYDPVAAESTLLASPPPAELIETMRALGVQQIGAGRVVVATRVAFEALTVQALRQLGLRSELILNKGALMILPSGIHKGTGLLAALERLAISPDCVVAVGDGENDEPLLSAVRCGVAVANAVPSLREAADLVTSSTHGQGVEEVVGRMIADALP